MDVVFEPNTLGKLDSLPTEPVGSSGGLALVSQLEAHEDATPAHAKSQISGLTDASTPTFAQVILSAGATSPNNPYTKSQTDALLAGTGFQSDVVDATLSTPPGGPAVGARYLVIPTGLGAWAGQDNAIATWTGAIWTFEAPTLGWLVYSTTQAAVYIYTSSGWNVSAAIPNHNDTLSIQGGSLTERYHLTSAQSSGLTGGVVTTLHKHAQSTSHESPDTDAAPTSLHHTLGTGANQAAAGNHLHAGVYAPAAEGVSNGNTHDHSGGDGGQIAHSALSGIGTNTHAQIDAFIAAGALTSFQGRTAAAAVLTKADVTGTGLAASDIDAVSSNDPDGPQTSVSSSPYTVQSSDKFLRLLPGAGSVTLDTPASTGRVLNIKNRSGGAVAIVGAIDGDTPTTLNNRASFKLRWNGSDYDNI